MEDTVAKISSNLSRITWLLIGAIVTGIVTIVFTRLK